MSQTIASGRLALRPVVAGDGDWLAALLDTADVRDALCDGLPAGRCAAGLIAASLDPASLTAVWRLATHAGGLAGFVGVRAPSTASLRLRAIGWRSLELSVALEPAWRGQGLATEALLAVAEWLRGDPVIFALVAVVAGDNERANALMRRCNFHVLGDAGSAAGDSRVYELPL